MYYKGVLMIDLGIQKGSKKNTDEYDAKFLNQLEPGDEITGEILIGEMKKRTVKKTDFNEFYVILTDDENEQKWICGFTTSYYPDSGSIYGEKGGRVYTLIDTLNHALNNTPLNKENSYSVTFDTFRENINKNVAKVHVKAVQSWNPNAKACNLEVLNAKISEFDNEASKLSMLADKNPAIKTALDNLKTKNKEINKKTIAFELKLMLDNEDIIKTEFKESLKELNRL